MFSVLVFSCYCKLYSITAIVLYASMYLKCREVDIRGSTVYLYTSF